MFEKIHHNFNHYTTIEGFCYHAFAILNSCEYGRKFTHKWIPVYSIWQIVLLISTGTQTSPSRSSQVVILSTEPQTSVTSPPGSSQTIVLSTVIPVLAVVVAGALIALLIIRLAFIAWFNIVWTFPFMKLVSMWSLLKKGEITWYIHAHPLTWCCKSSIYQ